MSTVSLVAVDGEQHELRFESCGILFEIYTLKFIHLVVFTMSLPSGDQGGTFP